MLRSIHLNNFRNHKNYSLTIHKPYLVILGPNMIGKTNILEAIYINSLIKSFRASDIELIHHGQTFYKIETINSDTTTTLTYNLSKAIKKSVLVNNSKKSLHSVIGLHPVVLFEPTHTYLFHSQPSLRRKYLDRVLSQVDGIYYQMLRKYNSLLLQRNSLLFNNTNGFSIKDELEVYNIQLSEPATYIFNARKAYLKDIFNDFYHYYQIISKSQGSLELRYITKYINDDYLEIMNKTISTDIAAKRTIIGPHRDDFEVLVNTRLVTKVSSRGEIRTLILALKLAEIQYLTKQTQKKPLLLLDDVFSELDSTRAATLFSTISDFQTIITTTHLDDVKLQNYQIEELT